MKKKQDLETLSTMTNFKSIDHPNWFILESSVDCSEETLDDFLSLCIPSVLSEDDPNAEMLSVNHVPSDPSAALNTAIRAHIGSWNPPAYGQPGLTEARESFWRNLYRLASEHHFVGGKWIFPLVSDDQADNVWADVVHTRSMAAKLSLRGPRRYLSVVCADFNDSRSCVNTLRVALDLVRDHGVEAPTAFKADVVSVAFPFVEGSATTTATLKAMRLTMPYPDWQARRRNANAVDRLDDSRLFHRALWLETEGGGGGGGDNQQEPKHHDEEREKNVSSQSSRSVSTTPQQPTSTSSRVRVATLLEDGDNEEFVSLASPLASIPSLSESLKRGSESAVAGEVEGDSAEPPKRPRLMKLHDLSDGDEEASETNDDDDDEKKTPPRSTAVEGEDFDATLPLSAATATVTQPTHNNAQHQATTNDNDNDDG
jgi:hypothetical protein